MTAGTRLGPYEILNRLGEGGMGAVYKARDTRLDRTVAALNHPHICQLYDVGPNYLVMEYVEGATLAGPLPQPAALEYAGQILDALEAAHRKGITHRDLKPANILVTRQGIKLLDFGLAKQSAPLVESDAAVTDALTAKGTILGTLQYMAPEQLQGKPVDARADLFAFGCVLYEMLSGKRAFDGSNAASVIAAVLERQPEPFSLTPPLDRVIRTCLEKDPDRRFQTAVDLKRSFNWAAAEEPSASPAPPSRRGWIAAAAGASLATAGGYWVGRRAQARAQRQVVRFQVAPPEGSRFRESDIVVSPDGRILAFVAEVKGQSQLWVRNMDSGEVRALQGTSDATGVFWSPDSRFVGYHAARKIWRIEVAGGAPLPICDAPTSRGAAWSEDGTIILGSSGGPLRRVPAAGGAVSTLTSLDEARNEHSHRRPQVLDGGRVMFWAFSTKEGNNAVFEALPESCSGDAVQPCSPSPSIRATFV